MASHGTMQTFIVNNIALHNILQHCILKLYVKSRPQAGRVIPFSEAEGLHLSAAH